MAQLAADLPFAAGTQSDQETATSNTVAVTPGRQHFHPGHPKCWAYVTVSGGTPTLAASYNITSITDAGVGILTITIGTDFSSANYAAALGGTKVVGSTGAVVSEIESFRAAGSIQLVCTSANSAASQSDPGTWTFAGFGDQ
jgi:hypothetical protein